MSTDTTLVRSTGLARLFYTVGLGIMFVFIARVGAGILIPLVIAIFLAFLIITLKNVTARVPVIGARLPDWFAFLVAFVVIGLAFFVLAEIVSNNINAVIDKAPEYQKVLKERSEQIIAWLRSVGAPIPEDYSLSGLLPQNITGVVGDLAAPARTLATSTVTIFLYTGFLLFERGAFAKKIAILSASPKDREHVDKLIANISQLMRQYVSIKTSTSVLTGALSFPVMLLLGIDFAGFWAILIIVLNFIPIIGSIVGVIFPVLLTIVQFGDLTTTLIALVSLTAVQQLVGSVIEPRMMGRSLNLSPLVILLSLTVWGAIWGVAGMLLCVPIMVIVTIALSQFETTRPVAVMLSEDGKIADLRKP